VISASPSGPRGSRSQRKARESNPHALSGAPVSTGARPTVSGYLPSSSHPQWTHRELNPDLLHAREVSSRWTMSPSFVVPTRNSGPAGESNPDLLGANQASFRWTSRPSLSLAFLPRSARDSNPVHLPTKEVCRHEHLRTDHGASSRPGRTRTCASLFVRQGPWPLGDGTMKESVSSRDGIRTHKHQHLVLAALPFAYPAVGHFVSF
jgi:hypothetical protein